MAAFTAVRAVSDSIVGFLNARHQTEGMPGEEGVRFAERYPATIRLVSSGELADDNATQSFEPALLLYLYRIGVNEQLRTANRLGDQRRGPMHLDLHYMLSVWSSSADTEHTLMTWALRTIQDNPVLDSSFLSPEGMWERHDAIQLTPEELTNEDLLRLWDGLVPSYRMSYTYVARVVTIDPADPETYGNVIVRDITVRDEERD
ncbi:MAG: DUF4255 domain-containing protein [Myxococcota bacterium]